MILTNEKIAFSVIIPTYNHARFINRCLDSLISQTYTDWEAIIVNNFSEDNTIELIEAYKDPRFKIVNFKNNGIIGASRNIGIKKSKSDWICFLDSDDWWLPNKLQVCHENIDENVDLIYHDLTIVRDKSVLFGKKRLRGRKLVNPVLIDFLVKGNCINNSSAVVRKSLLERINGISEDPQIIASEDYNTWLRIAQITDKFVYIPESLGFYILHGLGVSQKDMSNSMIYASSAFINILNESQRKRHESVIAYIEGRFAYNTNLFESAWPKLLYSLRYGNTMVRLKSLYMIGSILFKNCFFRYGHP